MGQDTERMGGSRLLQEDIGTEYIMTGTQIAALIGLPSILSAIVIAFIRWAVKNIKKVQASEQSVRLGVQALLRAQMINDYNHYCKKGYAPIYAKESFEACWKQYHCLGANGVMDDLHIRFMALPTEKAE